MDQLENQPCPMCHKNTMTLIENEMEVPYFGKCYLFSLSCSDCSFHKADVESVNEEREPCKIEFEVTDVKKDLSVRIVKSSHATVKIPTLRMSVEPAIASNGYITNVEGILNRFKKIIEGERDNAEENDVKKKAKNLLKKIWKIECGDEPVKIVIEDPSGNSAIISEKAVISKLSVKKKNGDK